jgi:hypothetical protein
MIKGKRGANILTENIIFIVLNLVFLAILVLFLFSKTGSAAVLEEKYSKQIAMLIDAAKPGMKIELDMAGGVEKTEKGFDKDSIVNINGNIVTVRLRDGKGYSYSFFNDIEVSDYFDKDKNKLILVTDRYNG